MEKHDDNRREQPLTSEAKWSAFYNENVPLHSLIGSVIKCLVSVSVDHFLKILIKYTVIEPIFVIYCVLFNKLLL